MSQTTNGTHSAVELPETKDWDDDCLGLDVARELWRFQVEKRRYDKATARAAKMKPGRRRSRLDNFTSHVAIPAMMEAEKGVLEKLFDLKPPVRASDEHGASAVRIGDHLVVGFCDAGGTGEVKYDPIDDHPQLLVIPIGATATVEATPDLHVPRAKRDRWEADKAAGRAWPAFPIFGKIPLRLPSGEVVELLLWAGSDSQWEGLDKERGDGQHAPDVPWAFFQSRGRTLAATARQLVTLECQPPRGELDPPADEPEPAATEPAA